MPSAISSRVGVPFTFVVLVVSVLLVPWLLPLYLTGADGSCFTDLAAALAVSPMSPESPRNRNEY